MPQGSTSRNLSRRKALAGIGAGGLALAGYATKAAAQGENYRREGNLRRCATVAELKAMPDAAEGDLVETLGFFSPGDGGGALYRVEKSTEETRPNDADVIAIAGGLVAVLLEGEAVNYRMFGAVSDGNNDDGVQIKLAHEYAARNAVPVVNLSGEFWIGKTNSIPILTNVHWGHTTFHIDERHNDQRNARFVILNDEPTQTLALDESTKAALLEKIRPGVQIIEELSSYAGHLITVVDSEDRIGIRAGDRYSKSGWAREELFYVEEEGRIIGDIAWQFNNFTSITATPCNANYLVVEGGGFRVSGDSPENSRPGYHHNGIAIRRSRTIIREQWVGLEQGRRDNSLEPRSGFYSLGGVYDVTLENIRAMPWEKNRRDKDKEVQHGTYGIAGARMLHCTFRNLTAEAGWVSWGVFGTNLNKNFRLENCRLNRVDVHFHCWNLHITNCTIGLKGISVTGGGDLVVENTVRDGSSFIHFRPDYGAKWDGHIRLRNCTLRPPSGSTVSVLEFRPSNFDYRYPIGFGRTVSIENLVIDYSAAPDSTAPCWLMNLPSFSKTKDGTRLFFPHRIEFRNIVVEGRQQGVRLMRIADPSQYEVGRDGAYDGSRFTPNCVLVCDNVQFEQLRPKVPEDAGETHLSIAGVANAEEADSRSLYPSLRFIDCEGVGVFLGSNVASAFFQRCTVNVVNAGGLRGELVFNDCRFQPDVQQAETTIYSLDSTLGTRFTNCTVHAPVVGGKVAPELVDRVGFVEINKSVRYYHLNTALGNEVLAHLKQQGIALSPDFVARLMIHYGGMES